jgi:Uncharacterised protein family UPF0547
MKNDLANKKLIEKIGSNPLFADGQTLDAKLNYESGIPDFDEYLNGKTLKEINAVIHLIKHPNGIAVKIVKNFSSLPFALAYSEIHKAIISEVDEITYLIFETSGTGNNENIVFSLNSSNLPHVKTFLKDILTGYKTDKEKIDTMDIKQNVVVRTYVGTQSTATAIFRRDAENMANQGYSPTSQNWAQGSYSSGAFIGALLLCIILIGIVVFIYMLIVKPDGSLSVTYELKNKEVQKEYENILTDKKCPMCAEIIKLDAKICRFCRHNFDTEI